MRGAAAGTESMITQPISQSTAIVLIVLILGASLYLWRMRYLRSRALMIAIAMILLGLTYYAATLNPVLSP
jgi:hypothetical protein